MHQLLFRRLERRVIRKKMEKSSSKIEKNPMESRSPWPTGVIKTFLTIWGTKHLRRHSACLQPANASLMNMSIGPEALSYEGVILRQTSFNLYQICLYFMHLKLFMKSKLSLCYINSKVNVFKSLIFCVWSFKLFFETHLFGWIQSRNDTAHSVPKNVKN